MEINNFLILLAISAYKVFISIIVLNYVNEALKDTSKFKCSKSALL